MKKARNYDLKTAATVRSFSAPRLPYQPPCPKKYRPRIGLIGCGGITASHLDAYRTAGWNVTALCDLREDAAIEKRGQYFPKADVYSDYSRLLARADIEVVDIALHPAPRAAAIEAALKAGKHVLSQKPFVLDLDKGEKLVKLADSMNLKLAVNQNGRWAPYVNYLYQALRAGCIGDIHSVNIALNWDHTWIQGTPFEQEHHVVLYDFAIHWFDMCSWFFEGRKAESVFAVARKASEQTILPPMIGAATVVFDGGFGQLAFDAHSRFGPQERISVTGSEGTLRTEGPICAAHDLALFNRKGCARPKLQGKWFNDGFRGAMGELLCAVEENREPVNSARANLRSLEIAFAAIHSADTGKVQIPGKVRKLRNGM
jgi:predicted dehydrogenase